MKIARNYTLAVVNKNMAVYISTVTLLNFNNFCAAVTRNECKK